MLRRGRQQQAATIERLRNCAKLIIHEARDNAAKTNFAHSCDFVHASARTAKLLCEVECAARTDVTLLITGETGTGKEVLAAQIHAWSGRQGHLVTVNCAGLHEGLIESEVFGHRKGAFTDATQDHAGAAKRASGGTLFLDEIGEISPVNQAKLLRLLESKEIKAVGSDMAERIDLRIIAATNRNLSKLVREGRFRLDLYHRLCVFVVEIPPLRERAEDIRPLAEHFIATALKRNHRRMTFSEEALATIARLELRGNARELRSLIERMVIFGSDGGEATPLAVHNAALQHTAAAATLDDLQIDVLRKRRSCSLANEIKAYEKELIRGALQKSSGSITEAARLLGISHQALTKKINSAHQDLQSARKQPRRRSIFRKET
ncbi:MAG: sigma 54-interacting transcriptional regulator [Pyrinomonadaceae bacterium]